MPWRPTPRVVDQASVLHNVQGVSQAAPPLDRIEPAAEGSSPRDATQLPLTVVRWLLIGALTLGAWAGAATMAVSAAHEWADLQTVWAWIAGVAATLPVAVGMLTAIDRLIEAPAPPKTSGGVGGARRAVVSPGDPVGWPMLGVAPLLRHESRQA